LFTQFILQTSIDLKATFAKTKEGRMLYYQSTTKAEGEQVEIYKALGLSHSILRGCKTIV